MTPVCIREVEVALMRKGGGKQLSGEAKFSRVGLRALVGPLQQLSLKGPGVKLQALGPSSSLCRILLGVERGRGYLQPFHKCKNHFSLTGCGLLASALSTSPGTTGHKLRI